MLRLLTANPAGEIEEGHAVEEIDRLIGDPQNLVWLDIDEDISPYLPLLEREFGFHPLALEDAHHPHQRPKVDDYESHAFIVLDALSADEREVGDRLSELAIFFGSNYLVTIHDGPLSAIDAARERWQRNGARSPTDAATLLHAIFDTVVDEYFPLVDEIAERTEELEAQIFGKFDEGTGRAIFRVRKDLLALRRVLGPMREVANVLARRDFSPRTVGAIRYFDDVYDHVIQLTDAVDISRDLLNGALDSYLSMTSNHLNKVMKTLTGASIILMSLALLAGIWGMNFQNMPELRWGGGYLFALLVMGGVGSALYLLFRRNDYL